MTSTANINKNISRARAKRIRRLTSAEKEAFYLLSDLLNCVLLGITYWDRLSDVQKIQLQEYYTSRLLYFLDFGNQYVSRSLHYRLREKTPEEEEDMQEGSH
jgi:hypothetical protein